MLIRASSCCLQRMGATTAPQQWMRRIAERIPAVGLSGSQLQALLDDEFPSFSPSLVGAVTLKEAVSAFPELLRVEDRSSPQSKWYVHPAEVPSRKMADAASSSTPIEDRDAAVRAIEHFCEQRARLHHKSYITLEHVLSKLNISDLDVVEDVMDNARAALEVQLGVRIKPKRTPRAVVAFVDGDGLPAVAVDAMCNELNLIKEESIMHIVRQPGTQPLSMVDTVCPDGVPTYLSIEKRARELRLRRGDLRRDVVYMCSASQFRTYAELVLPLNDFPDADVYVCSPSKIAVVKPKRVIPF